MSNRFFIEFFVCLFVCLFFGGGGGIGDRTESGYRVWLPSFAQWPASCNGGTHRDWGAASAASAASAPGRRLWSASRRRRPSTRAASRRRSCAASPNPQTHTPARDAFQIRPQTIGRMK